MSMEGLEALHHDSVLCWVVSIVSCSDTSSILTGRSRTGADRPSIGTSHHTKGYVKRRFFFCHSRPLVGMVRGPSGLGEGGQY